MMFFPRRWLAALAIVISTGVLSPASSAAADGPGTTGASYLVLPVGAASIAMGEAGAVPLNDPFGWLRNPGMIALGQAAGIGVFHSSYALDTYYDNAFYRHPLPRGMALAAGATVMTSADVKGYDASGLPTGDIDNGNVSGIVGVGWAPIEGLGVGLNVKYFQERIDEWTARGVGLDMGAVFQLPFPDVAVGATVTDIGPAVTFIEREEELPTTARIGASWRTPVFFRLATLRLAVEMVKPRREDAFAAFGAEAAFQGILFLRAGYVNDDFRADDGFTAGGGLRVMERLAIDYAYTPYGDLGNFHRVSVFFGTGR